MAKEEKKEKKKKVEEKKPVKEVKPKTTKESMEDKDFNQLVRVSGVVVDGNLDISRGLAKIKGVGPRISRSMPHILGVPKKTKIGSLDEKKIHEIEEVLENLHKHLPVWMINRRDDNETGEDIHLIGSELDMAKRGDINLQKKIRSYRGVRHSLNLPVRGQRTRTSFRRGTTIGVSRRKGLKGSGK